MVLLRPPSSSGWKATKVAELRLVSPWPAEGVAFASENGGRELASRKKIDFGH